MLPPRTVIPVPFCVTEPVPDMLLVRLLSTERANTSDELFTIPPYGRYPPLPPNTNVPEEIVIGTALEKFPVRLVVPDPI